MVNCDHFIFLWIGMCHFPIRKKGVYNKEIKAARVSAPPLGVRSCCENVRAMALDTFARQVQWRGLKVIDEPWVHMSCRLGPCWNAWTLSRWNCFVCVHIFFTVVSPFRIRTHHGNGATTLCWSCRWDARRARVRPIRFVNLGLTGVVDGALSKHKPSDNSSCSFFEHFHSYCFVLKIWFPHVFLDQRPIQ